MRSAPLQSPQSRPAESSADVQSCGLLSQIKQGKSDVFGDGHKVWVKGCAQLGLPFADVKRCQMQFSAAFDRNHGGPKNSQVAGTQTFDAYWGVLNERSDAKASCQQSWKRGSEACEPPHLGACSGITAGCLWTAVGQLCRDSRL